MNRISKIKIYIMGAFFVLAFSMVCSGTLQGQNDKQSAIQEKEHVQKKVRMGLDYYNTNNQQYTIRATVKTKEGRSYVTVKGATVRFGITNDIGEFEEVLGDVVSDENGVAELTGDIASLPELGTNKFIATIDKSLDFKRYSKNIEILNAKMAVEYETVDSVNLIRVQCSMADSAGHEIPIGGLDVKVYVERLFGELPVADEFNITGDDGSVEIPFPNQIPGGIDGELTIVVRITDHDEYGNLVNRHDKAWGIPTVSVDNSNERLLWAGKYRAPLPLVILINSILIVVWGLILYIVLNVFRIYRIGKAEKASIKI